MRHRLKRLGLEMETALQVEIGGGHDLRLESKLSHDAAWKREKRTNPTKQSHGNRMDCQPRAALQCSCRFFFLSDFLSWIKMSVWSFDVV